MSTLVITIISLCAIGVVSAVILYFVAQKFKVEEDPRIDIVEGLLPGANCGGCGYPGCRGLAEAAVKSETMEGILCPVGGAETMNKVAAALGREVKAQAPKIAVVRCNGTCENRPRTSQYDGALQTIRTASSFRRKREKASRPPCIGGRMLRPASRTVSHETVSASANILYCISY